MSGFTAGFSRARYLFDPDRDRWSRWTGDTWEALTAQIAPVITHPHFTGTGTRTLRDNGAKAIDALFARSFTAS